jgi:pimeloyl-ACP methyl ester carboxylesterase
MSSKAGFTTYPRMTAPSKIPDPLAPNRPLFPLLPHPEEAAPPAPPRPELAPPPQGWTRSYHAAPAAYPKELAEAHGTLSRSSLPYKTADAKAGETKEEKVARFAADSNKCVETRYAVHHWTYAEVQAAQPKGHWLAAERWRRDKPTGRGKVLVCTHANGLQKEHWHVALRSLLARDSTTPGAVFGTAAELGPTTVEIDDIWLLDDANHAASVDLNAGRLGDVQAWRDDSRDVLNFVTHVLPGVYASEGRPGWQLAWTDARPANMPKVVGIGHSFGGNALVQAAAARPDLFESLFLVDPMVPPHYVPYERWLKERLNVYALSAGAIRRRTHWPSRAEAAKAMRAQPFFAAWDKDVFDLYVAHGIVPVDYNQPEGEVTLATPAWCEAAVFTEPEGVAHGWMALPKLTCPVGFVMANIPVATYGEEKTRDMVWRPPRARNERFPDAGHLVSPSVSQSADRRLRRRSRTSSPRACGVSSRRSRRGCGTRRTTGPSCSCQVYLECMLSG